MSNGFGPLLSNLDAIRCHEYVGSSFRSREREYRLGSVWTSRDTWTQLWGVEPDDLEGDRLTIQSGAARKIAAAILYSAVDPSGIVDSGEALFPVAADVPAFVRVLRHILADELSEIGDDK